MVIPRGGLRIFRVRGSYLRPITFFARWFQIQDFCQVTGNPKASLSQLTALRWLELKFYSQKPFQTRKTVTPSGQNLISNILCWSHRPIPQLHSRIWEVILPIQKFIIGISTPISYVPIVDVKHPPPESPLCDRAVVYLIQNHDLDKAHRKIIITRFIWKIVKIVYFLFRSKYQI